MTPYETLSVQIAIGSVVVALVGMLTGIIGLVKAHGANKIANDSVREAKSANIIATEANGLAKDANRISAGASASVDEMKTIQSRAEARTVERHDVRWDGAWKTPGVYVITNRGESQAGKVNIVLSAEDEELEEYRDVVGSGESVEFSFHSVIVWFAKDLRRWNSLDPKFRAIESGFHGTVWVSLEVFWETELGAQRHHGPERYMDSLSDFY